mgnify:CR=1 FL=1
MMVSDLLIQNIHFLYVAISAFTTLALVLGDWDQQSVAYIHALVSFWSGLVYTNFIFEFFPVQFTPYVDWIFSTPLIVLAFGYSISNQIDFKLSLAVVSQVLVIVFGYLAFAMGNSLALFAGSTAFMVIMLSSIYLLTFEEYPQLFALLSLTWVGYPLIYLLYGGQLHEAVIPLVVLPLFSKHLFSIAHSSRAD